MTGSNGVAEPLSPELESLQAELLALAQNLSSGFGQLMDVCQRLARARGVPPPDEAAMLRQLAASKQRLAHLDQNVQHLTAGIAALQAPEVIQLLRDAQSRLQCIVRDQIQPALAGFDALLADWPEEEPA